MITGAEIKGVVEYLLSWLKGAKGWEYHISVLSMLDWDRATVYRDENNNRWMKVPVK